MENSRRILDLNGKMTGVCGNDGFKNKHEFKVLGKKEIDKNRSKAYKYLNF